MIFGLILVTLTSHFALVTSQYVASYCYTTGNYSTDSLYRASLNTLLASASSNMGPTGFYDASEGEVNAAALCRADIQPEECRRCIDAAALEIVQHCPSQYEAVAWYQYCMLRYSNNPILGELATSPMVGLKSSFDVSDVRQFSDARGALLDELLAQAADGGPLRKAAAGNTTTAPHHWRIYALVQCTPDLSPEDCRSCLAQAAESFRQFTDASLWATTFTPSCNVRYENVSFVNMTRLQQQQLLLQPSPGKNGDHRTRNIIIIIMVSIVALLAVVGILAMKKIKRKRKADPMMIGENDGEISSVDSIEYDFDTIRSATSDFSDANKLGQGEFGTVYKGKLENGREIAVKRVSKLDSAQDDLGFKKQVLVVARLQHRNLVRLLGFSIQGIQRLLVYEFVHNGSLDHFISADLDWDTRYKIIEGVARGVLYLHQDSRLGLIHRDLKASNVLLDQELNPKISDFGVAKLVPNATDQESSTSRILGTHGYMAPEYAFHGHYSTKSDVYSYGVLVLEIVSGHKTTFPRDGHSSGNLVSYAWNRWNEGAWASIIDPELKGRSGGSEPEMVRCIHIGLLCVQEKADDRPAMDSVVAMLNTYSSQTLPRPTHPGFYTMPSGPLSY